MISSKNGYVGDKKCIKYSGKHEELCDMLKVGDIVTLLWQSDDKVESIKVTGTVIKYEQDLVFVSTLGDNDCYVLDNPNAHERLKYRVTNISRPVDNMMPYCGGLWRDHFGSIWLIESGTLDGQVIEWGGNWTFDRPRRIKPEAYSDFAPFTKLTVSEEHVA